MMPDAGDGVVDDGKRERAAMSVADEVHARRLAVSRRTAAAAVEPQAAVLAAASVLPLRLPHPAARAVGDARAAGQPDPVLLPVEDRGGVLRADPQSGELPYYALESLEISVLRAVLRHRRRRAARRADGARASRSTGRSNCRSTRSTRRRRSRWCRSWCCGSASTCRPRSSWCSCSRCSRS